MPSTPSPSLRIELQETGESLNQWGTKLNQGLLMAEQALTGVLTKPLSGNVTLSVSNFVSDEARNSVLIFTAGSGLSAAPTVTLPPAPKSWHVDNRCGYPITFTMGGTTVTVPVGRQADVFCDGANLFMLEPIAAASAVTQAFADQAAVSAQTAMTSASTATTRRDQALAARDETYAARDTTLAYRDTTLGYRNAAAVSAQNAANSAAGVNLPAVSVADAGKALVVKSDGSGYANTLAKSNGDTLRALIDDAAYVTPKANADAMAFVTAVATTTIAPDFSLGFNRIYTMGLNATLGQPTNMKDGLPVAMLFVQDGTGGRTLSFSATYHKFPSGNIPTLSTAANAVDRLVGMCRNRSGTLVIEWSGVEKDIR